jgi:hypothetical protein
VGCCDHLPLIREKIAKGLYLHQALCEVAEACVGVDVQVDGIRMLHDLGFDQVYLPDDVPPQDFDVCLLADVIEHVGDPVSFLRDMRRHRFAELVVATPNAFRWRNLWPGPEVVNSDHRFWFTPYTLCKVLVDAGYQPMDVSLCHADHSGWKGALAARLADAVPRWRDMLIVRASPGEAV